MSERGELNVYAYEGPDPDVDYDWDKLDAQTERDAKGFAGIVDQLTAAVPPVRRAYSDAQARDEHGRWTSGGGGEHDLDEADRAAGRIKDALPRASVHISGLEPSSRTVLANTLERFAGQYPKAAASITSVEVKRLSGDSADTAAYTHDNNDKTYGLVLNTEAFGHDGLIKLAYDNPEHMNHARGLLTEEATLQHELGHVLDFHVEDVTGAAPHDDVFRWIAPQAENTSQVEEIGRLQQVASAIGTYSTSNPIEMFAESFAALSLGGPSQYPLPAELQHIVGNAEQIAHTAASAVTSARRADTCKGYLAKKVTHDWGFPVHLAYSADQPRDDHGRFGSKGGDSKRNESTSNRSNMGRSIIDAVGMHGGFSVLPLTGEIPTDGYMVAMGGTSTIMKDEDFFGPRGVEVLDRYLAAHAQEFDKAGAHLGLWHDTDGDPPHNEVVFDLSLHIDDEARALETAVREGQQSIFDVKAGDVITTKGLGTGARDTAETG